MLDDIIELAIEIVGELFFEGVAERITWRGTLKVLSSAALIGLLIWGAAVLFGG